MKSQIVVWESVRRHLIFPVKTPDFKQFIIFSAKKWIYDLTESNNKVPESQGMFVLSLQ